MLIAQFSAAWPKLQPIYPLAPWHDLGRTVLPLGMGSVTAVRSRGENTLIGPALSLSRPGMRCGRAVMHLRGRIAGYAPTSDDRQGVDSGLVSVPWPDKRLFSRLMGI